MAITSAPTGSMKRPSPRHGIAVTVMLIFANVVADFVTRHPSMKVLALSFLLLIGVLLTADAFGQHINRADVPDQSHSVWTYDDPGDHESNDDGLPEARRQIRDRDRREQQHEQVFEERHSVRHNVTSSPSP